MAYIQSVMTVSRITGLGQLQLNYHWTLTFGNNMQLLLRIASLHQTGNDLQEDPTTRGSEPLNRI